MNKQRFSHRLSELREKVGVSAREMSLALGQNSSYINHIENGQALPSMQGFFNICEYLRITPMEFFEYDNRFPNQYHSILSNLKELNYEETKCINTVIS